MKTFNEWIETAPSWIKARDHAELVRMQYAFTEAQIDVGRDALILMQQAMLRGVEAAS